MSADAAVSTDRAPRFADRVVSEQQRLRPAARKALLTSSEAAAPTHRVIGPLTAAAISTAATTSAWLVVRTSMEDTLGVSSGATSLLLWVSAALGGLAGLLLSMRRERRRWLLVGTSLAGTASAVTFALSTNVAALLAASAVGALPAGAVAMHLGLISDAAAPAQRHRAITLYVAGLTAGVAAGALVAGPLADRAGWTWRAVLLVVAGGHLASAALLLATPRLSPAEGNAAGHQPASPGERLRAGFLARSTTALMFGHVAIGVLGVPLFGQVELLVERRFRVTSDQRALAMGTVIGIVALATPLATHAVMRRSTDLSTPVRRAGALLAVAAVLNATAPFLPGAATWAVLYGGILLAATVARCTITYASATVVGPDSRPVILGAAVACTALGVFVGFSGMQAVDGRFGVDVAAAVASLPVLQAGVGLLRLGRSPDEDVDTAADHIVERSYVESLVRSKSPVPLLACRGIDFSYGPVQVLFGVDFAVDDGEMVSLLGTNGAGKSTLLRVISGLGMPSAGTVRLYGEDITFVSAERRIARGLTQVPGGRAVFPSMSVVENLRVYGYSHGRDRRAVERGLEASLATFPSLDSHRNRPAGALSGGQQQMLGLAKALIVQPRLLLIDELSLGLAPMVVRHLLTTLREINTRGTAVVLVEQSVSVALEATDHAYFMEKGAVHFDGPTRELLGRPDLVRSVYLEGAGKGLSTGGM